MVGGDVAVDLLKRHWWCLLLVLIRQGLGGWSGPPRLTRALGMVYSAGGLFFPVRASNRVSFF